MGTTVRTKDELNKAVKDKCEVIYFDGPIKDELVKSAKNKTRNGTLIGGAGIMIGGILGGPFAILGLGALIGGASSGLKYAKYDLCMEQNGTYYLKRR